MRAAAYIRVSTEKQAAEEKVSLTEQRKDIDAYCADRAYSIVEVYQDVGSGASKRRRDFQRMLRDAQAGHFDVIVAWKADRLSRGMFPAAALMEAIENTEIKLEAVKDAIDLNTFGILAAVGKIELDNIKQRMVMGQRGRAKKGKVPPIVKFGYRRVGFARDGEDTAEIDPAEAPIVRQIFEAYASGTPLPHIAQMLNAQGSRTRQGHLWGKRHIHHLIDDPIYKGEGYYGRRKRRVVDMNEDNTEVVRVSWTDKDTWIPISYPEIVDPHTWQAAHRVRRRTASIYESKGLDLQYPLRGLVRCGSCGNRFYPQSQAAYAKVNGTGKQVRADHRARRRRYVCYGAVGKHLDCPKKRFGAVSLEGKVWGIVREVIGNPEGVAKMLQERRQMLGSDQILPQLEKARRQLTEVKDREGRILDLYLGADIDREQLDERMTDIQAAKTHWQGEVDRLGHEIEQAEAQILGLRSLKESMWQVRRRLDTMTDEEKTEVVRLVIDSVLIHSDIVEVVVALDNRGGLTTSTGQCLQTDPVTLSLTVAA